MRTLGEEMDLIFHLQGMEGICHFGNELIQDTVLLFLLIGQDSLELQLHYGDVLKILSYL